MNISFIRRFNINQNGHKIHENFYVINMQNAIPANKTYCYLPFSIKACLIAGHAKDHGIRMSKEKDE